MLRILFIFLCLSYGLAQDLICPVREEFWPHSDCGKYYICSNGVSSIMECPEGLFWNSVTKTCSLLTQVPECSGGTRSPINQPLANVTRIFQSPTARRFVNLAMRTCLDSDNHEGVSSRNCNNGDFQNWVWRSDLTIRNVGTGKCLQSNGATVFTHDCDSAAAYQKWVSTTNLVFKNVMVGQCLECNEFGEVYLYYCNDRENQKWTQ